MTKAVANDPAASILFSSGKQLTLDDVADAAIELVDRPRLVRTIPAYRAAMVHALRPFPQLGLPLLEDYGRAPDQAVASSARAQRRRWRRS